MGNDNIPEICYNYETTEFPIFITFPLLYGFFLYKTFYKGFTLWTLNNQ